MEYVARPSKANNRTKTPDDAGEVFGIKCVGDSRITVVTFYYHTEPESASRFDEQTPDFRIAHAGQLDRTNVEVAVALVRVRPNDTDFQVSVRFRYLHRNSVSAYDGLDLKVWYHGRKPLSDTTAKELIRDLEEVIGVQTAPPLWIVDLPLLEFMQAIETVTERAGWGMPAGWRSGASIN